MKEYHDDIRVEIAHSLHAALMGAFPEATPQVFAAGPDSVYDGLATPPTFSMGHLALGCFPLAKPVRMAPPQIAAKVVSAWDNLDKAAKKSRYIRQIEATGPYVNIHLDFAAVAERLLPSILSGELFERPLAKNPQSTMVEFSQPNTHKELHVGHMRNLSLGDAIVRVLRRAGYSVVASTYPGDSGTHVAKCLWYLQHHNKDAMPETRRGQWLGKMYSKGHLLLEDEADPEKKTLNQRQLGEILSALHSGQGEMFELWKTTRQWSLEMMGDVYRWAGVAFDRWYFESEEDAPSLKLARQFLAEGRLVTSDGAVGMDLRDKKLGFLLLIKSDGNGLYSTKDMALAFRKFEEFHVERNIYVVDNRQAMHFAQVFECLRRLGFPHADKCVHLAYEHVELPDGPMSSRKGNIVPLEFLIDRLVDSVKTTYLERYRGEWSDAEIEETAHIIAQGAIRYGMVRVDHGRKIVFAMDEWLKIDGESGPYAQYAYARIASLIRKADVSPALRGADLLAHGSEQQLILKLLEFNHVIADAAENTKTAGICAYIFDLAKLFNAYYTEVPIGRADDVAVRETRLALSLCIATVIRQGLSLLGIDVPERM